MWIFDISRIFCAIFSILYLIWHIWCQQNSFVGWLAEIERSLSKTKKMKFCIQINTPYILHNERCFTTPILRWIYFLISLLCSERSFCILKIRWPVWDVSLIFRVQIINWNKLSKSLPHANNSLSINDKKKESDGITSPSAEELRLGNTLFPIWYKFHIYWHSSL